MLLAFVATSPCSVAVHSRLTSHGLPKHHHRPSHCVPCTPETATGAPHHHVKLRMRCITSANPALLASHCSIGASCTTVTADAWDWPW